MSRRPVPGMNPSVVEYDDQGNIVLTGTDIPATPEDIMRAEGEDLGGSGDSGGGSGG